LNESELQSSIEHQAEALRYYTARPAWQWFDLKEIWRFRELIWMFALRDLKVRYRQTIVGVLWAILQPLVSVAVFGVLFAVLKGKPTTGETPYAVTSLCALLPWQLFANSLTASTQSLVANQNLITKVYFPRVSLPISAIIGNLVDFGIGFVILLILLTVYSIVPTVAILLLPLMVLLVIVTSLAFSLWFSALNAIYRDVQYIVPFIIQIGVMISPVYYETAIIPKGWLWLYSLNPMVGVLEGFRWALLGLQPPSPWHILLSCVCILLVLAGGAFYFRRMERFFADRI